MRRRILFCLTTLEVGGAERSLLELVKRLDRGEFELRACTLLSGGRLKAEFENLDIPVSEFDVRSGLAELRGLRILPLLVRMRPDVVHGRLILANLWARLGRATGARVICEERGLATERPRIFTTLNRATLSLCDVVVSNSVAVAQQVRRRDRVPASRMRVIYGGVDCDRFTPASEGADRPFDLVSVTRLERYKGVFELIQAMAQVVAHRPGTRLSVVGGGGERAALEAEVRRLSLGDTVTFHGEDFDIPQRLREARLFVLSSHEEGLPNAVLEAMAAGLPVVATAVGGTPELVARDLTGRLVPPRNPSALADAILAYLGEPGRLDYDGRQARKRAVELFDLGATAKAYSRLYRELASRPNRAA